ncbi:hypothetical protein EIN_413660 [Entamoeba invadens IP1]|uniref:Uncharacterized protein n=1 Tax=Entamoeba invadens IP1 TaxID=370355 RepID=L7FNA2_ENTIV|nr:hypothetical protein EIN_413660 [Entamoeba invadens IP1]ELP91698.1 hypothetical protein EIN_413660 [Entamoeba invadens IP1]|eukprot:XP_004258469.1 hypothetical protein EIN_413660 [Entamoeba invadens IP1]
MRCSIQIIVPYVFLFFILFYLCFFLHTNGRHRFVYEEILNNQSTVIAPQQNNPSFPIPVGVFHQPEFHNKIIDLRTFNYEGKCREPFQYQQNNKRDLWLTAVGFKNHGYWLNNKNEILLSYALANSTIPNADRVLLLMPGIHINNFVELTESYGIRVVNATLPRIYNIEKCQDASKRMFAFHDFVLHNREKYDRILISDHRDVFIFADFFETFSKEELVFTAECGRYKDWCLDFNSGPDAYRWMAHTYGVNAANEYRKNNSIYINVGTIFGGTGRILKYLDLMVKSLVPAKWDAWGHDQTVHDFVFYSYFFQRENVTMERCSQRFCFLEKKPMGYDAKNKTLMNIYTGCAPVMRHKVPQIYTGKNKK